jgi:hypothetical protein
MKINDVLLSESKELECKLLGHFVDTCLACANLKPKKWMFLCSAHSLVARAVLDTDYLPSLKRNVAAAMERIGCIQATLTLFERIEKGHAWVTEQTEERKRQAGQKKIEELEEAIPAAHRSMSRIQLEAFLQSEQGRLAELEQRLERMSKEAKKLLEEAV